MFWTRGKPCGQYFVYKQNDTQQFISFVLNLTGAQPLPLGEHPEDLAVKLIEFKPDKTAASATAQMVSDSNLSEENDVYQAAGEGI